MTLQDIKETKRYGWTEGRMHGGGGGGGYKNQNSVRKKVYIINILLK